MRWTGQFLLLPFYHLVADTPPPHIRHLYPVRSRAQFRRDLDFLLTIAAPISVHGFLENVQQRRRFERPVFLLSFDDGLRECHDVVTPILEEYGLEAICFLNSDFIGNKSLFYRFTASLLIEQLNRGDIPPQKAAADFREVTGQRPGNLRRQLLAINYQDRSYLEQLALRWKLDIPHWLAAERPYLNLQELQDMSGRGWTFGAHSIDHPMYRFLSVDQQIDQTQKSMEAIRNLGVNSRDIFAFPFTDFGVDRSFFDWMYEEQNVVVSFGCAGLKKEAMPGHFQRIIFERSGLEARDIIYMAYISYLLKAILGRHLVRRD
jgi:peptidoglycan/xylan/chitin deacetylase (PgdA/CDA1 family)